VWNAYRQNLSIVLSHVEKLLPQLDGTTVISSDHGNIFNERVGLLFPFRISGHRKNFHVKQLVKVPWLIVKNQREVSAPQINPITNAGDDLEDDERIKDRLRKLGYI
jgi:membrane-anchored protein YejM (alkaline phosphatase superfamily)